MGQEVVDLEGANWSDRLAVERTLLAADRSLLAWVRTSLSLVSFGFTIYKVLDHVQKAGAITLVRAQTPRNIGIFMLLVGIVPLALAMSQYGQAVKRLGGGSNPYTKPSMIAALAILLLGLALLVVTVLSLDVI